MEYRGVEMRLHSFLISALNEVKTSSRDGAAEMLD
jgi:hypothetical protein